jgi:heme-degrading monooxygenase HmoA
MDAIAQTPEPPYYAVIFTSVRNAVADDWRDDGYEATAARMVQLASSMPGFLGVESARDGLGITVCYWEDEASIAGWKAHAEHDHAQQEGRNRWYADYALRVARVERAYDMTTSTFDAAH